MLRMSVDEVINSTSLQMFLLGLIYPERAIAELYCKRTIFEVKLFEASSDGPAGMFFDQQSNLANVLIYRHEPCDCEVNLVFIAHDIKDVKQLITRFDHLYRTFLRTADATLKYNLLKMYTDDLSKFILRQIK